jgi:hypothetical protein
MRLTDFIAAMAVLAGSAPGTPVLAAGRPTPSVAMPAEVCSAIDLLNRSIDQVLAARKLPLPPEPINHERGLRLEHVYQLHMACLEQLHEIEAQRQIGRIPPLAAARPGLCTADDVVALSKIMHDELKRPAWILWVVKLPEERAALSDKTADDAFAEALRLYVKMNALAEKRQVAADEVYAQLVRCVADAKAVLRHIDGAHRYRIDAPHSESARHSSDVYSQCVAARRALGRIAQELNQSATPTQDANFSPAGEDAFVQTQILLAELNRLKLNVGTTESTPLAIRSEGKTWTDAHNQAALLNYLLGQFSDVRRLAASDSTGP